MLSLPNEPGVLFVRDSRPKAEPAPSVADLLAQLIEGQAAITRRLDALEVAQERRHAAVIDAAGCADGTAEVVRLLLNRTLIPEVRAIADHLGDIGNFLAYYAPDAAVIPFTDSTDSTPEDPK